MYLVTSLPVPTKGDVSPALSKVQSLHPVFWFPFPTSLSNLTLNYPAIFFYYQSLPLDDSLEHSYMLWLFEALKKKKREDLSPCF